MKPLNLDSSTVDGFILSVDWRDHASASEITVWAASDFGPIRAVFDGVQPVFFVRSEDLTVVEGLSEPSVYCRALDLRTLDADPVHGVYFPNRRALNRTREVLEAQIPVYEADVKPAERFLMERHVFGSVRIQGKLENRGDYMAATNPKLSTGNYKPKLTTLSLDIETSGDGEKLYSIACVSERRRAFVVGAPTGVPAEAEIEYCSSETELLLKALREIEQADPDVIVGWNIVNFDLNILERKCRALGIPFTLGRSGTTARIIPPMQPGLNAIARIPGRAVLDGIECLKSAFWIFDSYALDFVAQQLLNRRKQIDHTADPIAEITRLFDHDKPALARYNLEDCELVLEIFRHARLLEFVVERTRLTGLSLGRQGGSVAAFDYLYLPRLHRKGWVAPTYSRRNDSQTSPGGYVLDSHPGIYDNVVVLDFKSLYPSIIRTFLIDPLGLAQPGNDPVPGFLEAEFSREDHLLPGILEELWSRRELAKAHEDDPLEHAIKILMNSFYGVLGAEGCRFYDPRLASSITLRGHEIIQQSRLWIEDKGLSVIYGDTDSLFVLVGEESSGGPETLGRGLAAELNEYWHTKIEGDYALTSFLEIEFETLYKKFFMPSVRGSEAGSKKRYAGLTGEGIDSLIIKGLEAARSDWTELAREFQRELIYAVFTGQDAEQLIRETMVRLRSGQEDKRLIYRKKLRQRVEEYKKNIPPHVKAARQLQRPGKEIAYYVTMNGPEPVQLLRSPLDYEHYLDRQIKPIADSIIRFLGLHYDRIVSPQQDFFQ